jgi:hypothetical protein
LVPSCRVVPTEPLTKLNGSVDIQTTHTIINRKVVLVKKHEYELQMNSSPHTVFCDKRWPEHDIIIAGMGKVGPIR